MAVQEFLTLPNGFKMPQLGLGTWRAPDAEVEAAIEAALEAGYRHFDCAPVYGNEKVIGRVFKKWFDSGKLSRSDLWITTKLPPSGNRGSSVEKYITTSLNDLQCGYLDLYLIHSPMAVPDKFPFERDADGLIVLDTASNLLETWKVLEQQVELGRTRFIGVSNFNEKQIQRIINFATIKPSNLQVELHLYLQQPELVEFAQRAGLTVTAYSPLGSSGIEKLYSNERNIPKLMENEEVIALAAKYNKSPAQILLRQLVQRGVAPIPKSTNPGRLRQNLDVFDFELTDAEMNQLAALDKKFRVCDMTFLKGIEKHPEYPW